MCLSPVSVDGVDCAVVLLSLLVVGPIAYAVMPNPGHSPVHNIIYFVYAVLEHDNNYENY